MFLILGIIPSKYVAPILNDGKFSASLVNKNTQAITMDEWTSSSLACEDAKRVLQGMFLMYVYVRLLRLRGVRTYFNFENLTLN